MWWWVAAFGMTADEAVEAALARSPTAALGEARVAEAEARAREATGRLLPAVSLTAGAVAQTPIEVDIGAKLPELPLLPAGAIDPLVVQPGFQLQGGAQLVQPLVAPQGWAARRAAADGVELAQARAAAERAAVTRRALEAWHGSAAARAALEDARRAQAQAERLVGAGEALVAAGVAPRDAVLPFRRAEASARAAVRVAEQGVLAADGVLGLLTGRGEGADLAEPPTALPALEGLLARLGRPELQAAEAQVQAARGQVAVARGGRLPTLALVGGLSAISPAPDLGEPVLWRVGLAATVPVFQGGASDARVQAAHAVVAQAEAGVRGAWEAAEAEVRLAHGALARALASLDAHEEAVALAGQAVEAAERRLAEGGGSLLELQQAQAEQLGADRARTLARAEAARAADLLRLAVDGSW